MKDQSKNQQEKILKVWSLERGSFTWHREKQCFRNVVLQELLAFLKHLLSKRQKR